MTVKLDAEVLFHRPEDKQTYSPGTVEIIQLLTNDHREVDELFRRFHLSDRDDTIDDLTKQIIHELSVHAAVEEIFVYPLIRATVEDGNDLADHAIEEHQEAKGLVPTHPHPLVPGTATAQLVAGPWASVVDKARDLFN